MVDKICEECGESFTPYHISTQKYCGPCRDKGEWFLSRFNLRKRLGSLAYSARNRAKTKGVPFDINTDYLIELWEQQGMQCPISGRMFDLDAYGNKSQVNPDAPSVDRIIPEKGYIKGNVRLVTYLTNVCLNEYGEDFLVRLCEDILETQSRRGR